MNSRGVGTLRGLQGRLGALIAMIRALGTHVSGLRRDVAALIVDRPTHHARIIVSNSAGVRNTFSHGMLGLASLSCGRLRGIMQSFQ